MPTQTAMPMGGSLHRGTGKGDHKREAYTPKPLKRTEEKDPRGNDLFTRHKKPEPRTERGRRLGQ